MIIYNGLDLLSREQFRPLMRKTRIDRPSELMVLNARYDGACKTDALAITLEMRVNVRDQEQTFTAPVGWFLAPSSTFRFLSVRENKSIQLLKRRNQRG
jgi:hypothetical protein